VLEGDNESAALVIAASAAGLGAGAAVAKFAKARRAAQAAKQQGKLTDEGFEALSRSIDDAERIAREAAENNRTIKAPPKKPGQSQYVNPARGHRVTSSGRVVRAEPGTPRGQGQPRAGKSDPRAAAHIASVASRLPWGDAKLWILQGRDRAQSGAHQIVALKDRSGKTYMFYKSSGTNPDEFGNYTSNWLHLNGIALKDDLVTRDGTLLPPTIYFVKTSRGAKTNPSHLQPLADQLNELDRLVDGPGIAFITKYLPDFKIESMSDAFSQQGVSDIARFNQWADSLGAIGEYGMGEALPGINLTMDQAIRRFDVPEHTIDWR
jgi:hypothetical protein